MTARQPGASAVAGIPTGRSTVHIVLIAATAALGGFLFGFDTAVINGAVTAIQNHFHAGPLALGQAVASALLGSAAGAFFAGRWAGRLGRIPVMVIAAVLFFVSALGSGLGFALGADVAGPVALFSANFYVFFFGMSWGPVVWVLLGEMFNNRIRAIALSVAAAAAQRLANWVVSVSFPYLKDAGLGLAYGLAVHNSGPAVAPVRAEVGQADQGPRTREYVTGRNWPVPFRKG